jgi:peptidoglycan hydrolase-like protein with peptidoglycan-binding domain
MLAVVLAATSMLGVPRAAAAAQRSTSDVQQNAGRVAAVDWSAGPVAWGSGYWRPNGSRRVRDVQRRLRALGFATGPVDGLFGPRTDRAVRRFQREAGLEADGIAGPRTLRIASQSGQGEGRRDRSERPAEDGPGSGARVQPLGR